MAKRKDLRSAADGSASIKAGAAAPEISIMAPAMTESAGSTIAETANTEIQSSEPITLPKAPTLAPTVADMLIGPRKPVGPVYTPASPAASSTVEALTKIAAELAATPDAPQASAISASSDAKVTASAPAAPAPSRSFLRLAATVALAAALGAVLGAGGVSAFSKLTATPVVHTVEANPSRAAKLEGDIAALKASFEASAKNTNGQFGKLAERLERAEKAQAEPTAKLTKLSDKINEALERFDQRLAAASAPETTGSITPNRSFSVASAADPKQDKVQDKVQTTPAQPVIAGWVLRDIFDGRALVESQFGMYEVAPGGNLPGIGRVASIKRQDGRWVVITPKGVIVSER